MNLGKVLVMFNYRKLYFNYLGKNLFRVQVESTYFAIFCITTPRTLLPNSYFHLTAEWTIRALAFWTCFVFHCHLVQQYLNNYVNNLLHIFLFYKLSGKKKNEIAKICI